MKIRIYLFRSKDFQLDLNNFTEIDLTLESNLYLKQRLFD